MSTVIAYKVALCIVLACTEVTFWVESWENWEFYNAGPLCCGFLDECRVN